MSEIFVRSENLIGSEALLKLKNAHVAVFGVGGVGSAAVEALARAGVGKISVFDGDCVTPSNINRQLIALHSTLGTPKVEATKQRILDINPDCEVFTNEVFYTADNADLFDLSIYDYIIDAIDMVSAKIELICRAKEKSVPIISSMGTGNKLDPTAFEVADIFKTSVCPLARVMRRELKMRGIINLKVVYSKEEPRTPLCEDKRTPASISFVPPVAGYIIAGEVIKEISKI